jgi:hypothetical protein
VNILDENIIGNQRQLLRSWRIPIRHIGYDLRQQGIKDEEIIPFLCQVRRPTFFTRDLGFYKRTLCHARYCLVCLVVEKYEVAGFVRRLLSYPEFDTQAKRMGTVIRVSQTGLSVWRLHAEQEIRFDWPK